MGGARTPAYAAAAYQSHAHLGLPGVLGPIRVGMVLNAWA